MGKEQVMSIRNLLGIIAALAVACSSSHDGDVRSFSQSVSIPGLTPEPCDWDGNTVELLVADAWTGCSALASEPGGGFSNNFFGNDPYLTQILEKMGMGNAQSPDPFGSWYDLRQSPTANCDPVTHTPVGFPVSIPLTPVPEHVPIDPNDRARHERADGELRQAGINLCIAQRLRTLSPGASAGESLLLSDADQRLLLETIRERVQIAMLQYALLGVVFSTNPKTLSGTPLIGQRIPILQDWANDPAKKKGALVTMGRDFAAAVQLHSIVSMELFHLFARSRSARSKRGGVSATRADETWGAGSWHQRLLAVAYGGDPLAIVDEGTPWQSWNPETSVSGDAAVGFQESTPRLRLGWPGALKRPYVTASVTAPQVRELLALAKRFDRLELRANAGASCEPFDVDTSAKELYKAIEGELRVADCYRDNSTDPCPTTPTPPAYEYGAGPYLLWQKYHITPEHARTLAKLLQQSLGGRNPSATCNPPGLNLNDAQFGGRNILGTVTDAGNGVTHFSKDSEFTDVLPSEVAGTFTRNASLRFPLPWEIDSELWDVIMAAVAFDDVCFATGCTNHKNADAKRLMGAASAQAATREMVASSVAWIQAGLGPTSTLYSYFLQADDILGLIEANVGAMTASVRPEVVRDVAVGSGLPGTKVRSVPGGYAHSVQLLVPPGDTWWDNCSAPNNCTVTTGLVAVRGPWARALAANPDSSIYGKTLASLAFEPGNPVAFGATLALPAPVWIKSMPKLWIATPLVFEPVSATPGSDQFDATSVWTLVAVRNDSSAPPGEEVELRVVASNVKVGVSSPRDAQYFATGGAMGMFLGRQTAVRGSNPSEPAFDGFDLPTAWVPPLAAQLVGGVPGQTSSDVYLQLAKDSAAAATSAVESALQNLTLQQEDEGAKAAAAAKASAGIKEERDGLCGANNPSCDTSVTAKTVANPFTAPASCPTATSDWDPQQTYCQLDQFVYERGAEVAAETFAVGTPVAESLNHPIVPAFTDYSGGSLQAAFIQQWSAFNDLPQKLDLMHKAAEAAKTTVAAAYVALQTAEQNVRNQCGSRAMDEAMVAGKQVVGGSFSSATGPCTEDFCYQAKEFKTSGSWSLAPLIAQRRACDSALIGVNPAQASVIAAQAGAFAQIGNAAVGLRDAVTSLRLSSADLGKLTSDAELADRRHRLEQNLVRFGLKTSFSAYRISRSYDLWRARALVESARRYGLAARRAIEARYVVNLSELDKDEVFVASPRVWADEIYGYDLTLPAAVGLTVSGSSAGDAVYSNKLSDYSANLEGFVNGYAASRPAAVATNEIDIVTLPGLQPAPPIEVPIDPTDPNSPTVTAFPTSAQWLLRCTSQGTSQWVPATVGCDGPIDRAKLLFALDPWGRRDGDIANAPFDKRFNGRWDLLAVNFVGTGIRDCVKATDPNGCYSEPYLRYNLTQTGTPWVTDFDGFWRLLEVPTGRIEGAKAIAAELWLDPLKDGWTTSYISAVARSEWQNRPLGGAYELEFEVTPDVRLDRIERLQLLVGSTSWVKQN